MSNTKENMFQILDDVKALGKGESLKLKCLDYRDLLNNQKYINVYKRIYFSKNAKFEFKTKCDELNFVLIITKI